jgi:hypothetical protein
LHRSTCSTVLSIHPILLLTSLVSISTFLTSLPPHLLLVLFIRPRFQGLDLRCLLHTRQWYYRSINFHVRRDLNHPRPAIASLRSAPACRGDYGRYNHLSHHGFLTILPQQPSPQLTPPSSQVTIAATVVRLPLVDEPGNPAAAYPSPLLFLYALEDGKQHTYVFSRSLQSIGLSTKPRHLRLREQHAAELCAESTIASFADAQSSRVSIINCCGIWSHNLLWLHSSRFQSASLACGGENDRGAHQPLHFSGTN